MTEIRWLSRWKEPIDCIAWPSAARARAKLTVSKFARPVNPHVRQAGGDEAIHSADELSAGALLTVLKLHPALERNDSVNVVPDRVTEACITSDGWTAYARGKK